jgi:hypothetical protein
MKMIKVTKKIVKQTVIRSPTNKEKFMSLFENMIIASSKEELGSDILEAIAESDTRETNKRVAHNSDYEISVNGIELTISWREVQSIK